MSFRIIQGDVRQKISELPSDFFHTCVTSPPYFGLRNYGVDGQIGLEQSPEAYVYELVKIFRGVRKALRNDGTLWLNLGDTYCGGGRGGIGEASTLGGGQRSQNQSRAEFVNKIKGGTGLKTKDLIGIPWRVALALQSDGWYLRSDIIWQKPNCIPESVIDRPTKAHEYIFLLAKSENYFFDRDGFAEECKSNSYDVRRMKEGRIRTGGKWVESGGEFLPHSQSELSRSSKLGNGITRNRRSVWTVSTVPFSGAHFATFPPKLIEPCVLAGSPKGGEVIDPFSGAGTTGVVCKAFGRNFTGIELNPAYIEIATKRIEEAPDERPLEPRPE